MRLPLHSKTLPFIAMVATSQGAHPDPTAPSVQPTQQPTPLTSSSITIPSTISTIPASPTPTPRSYNPTPQSFFVDTSTACDIINGTTYLLTYTDLVYGTLHIPYIPPSTTATATATETASGAASAVAVTQGMTNGENRNAAAASVTPANTDTEVSLGSVVPKGTATWAVSTQRSGGGTGRGRRGSRRWEWLAGWVGLWGFELVG